ncbi:acyltransferase [Paraglaciecola aquimarina]|uniref:Acyltransferase n=1 Tax=Paraglaciecola algarum TaxID=3050085 RepID=A0ABS9DCN4_9ALTE|nr:acyltransferase [Paraglaciecola sp. G1-23]MCF2949763.1 acyltransferase [Paraglaciecola sp. G1-23]
MDRVSQISGLTPLRGMAAVLVIVMHYQLFVAPLVPMGMSHIFDKLYLMVDLFFVLSGFIMYHVYGNYFKQGVDKHNFWPFIRARFARIYPLHFVTLVYLIILALTVRGAGFSIDGFAGDLFSYPAIPSQLLMLQATGIHHEALWNTPTWSISTEWWAYMLFPFLMLVFFRSGLFVRILFAVGAIAGYLWIMFDLQPAFWANRWIEFNIPESVPYPVGIIDVITGSALLRCFCGFVYGTLIYELYLKNILKPWLKAGLVFIFCWLVLFVLWHFNRIYDPISVFIFGLMILSLAYNSDGVGRFFNGRIFQFLGDISYSLYLVHMPILLTFIVYRKAVYYPDAKESMAGVGYTFPLEQAWVGLVVFVVISLILSKLSYQYIEKPARRYLKGQ